MNLNSMVDYLKVYNGRPLRIMEVCGTHTSAIIKSGMRSILSENIHLISGPGCPVCVTPAGFIDVLRNAALAENAVVLSFGDMLRVPGTDGSLADARALGGDIRMVYSPFEALELSAENPDKQFVFAAVGFETIAPVYALLLERALERNIKNLKLLTGLKTMPAVLKMMCCSNVDALIAPGHVAAITGASYFNPIAENYKKPFCIAGFTDEAVISSVYDLVVQCNCHSCRVHNLYSSVVTLEGNLSAQEAISRVFEPSDAIWRGMGVIPGSGLKLKGEYSEFEYPHTPFSDTSSKGCRCGDVIRGAISPCECKLFGKSCTPSNPKGPCMVSHEGACGIWYNGAI